MEENNISKFIVDDTEYETTLPKKFHKRKAYQRTDFRKITAFIPGLIVSLHTEKGKKVKAGERLLVLEAMKMRNDVAAPVDGVVKVIAVQEGNVVVKGQLLIELE
jgi:biotin carboxyl carrier protein